MCIRDSPLIRRLVSDKLHITFEQRHLYSYTTTKRPSGVALNSLLRWIIDAQHPDGGIAAYYSLLTGYSQSYPEVTGYIVPTLYDFARSTRDDRAVSVAESATRWLLSLQMPTGAFPGGLHGGLACLLYTSLFPASIASAKPRWMILTSRRDWRANWAVRTSRLWLSRMLPTCSLA